jgi:putative transcriptional regulator
MSSGAENRPESPRFLPGYFLISETELLDPNFIRTVVLMIHHDPQGAFGLVVNRQTEATLSALFEKYEDTPQGDIPVFIGGPVEQQYLFVIHSGLPDAYRSEHAAEVVDGVVFEPNFHLIDDYLADEWPRTPPEDRPHIHLFGGYSGWGPGQLENELKHRSWVILPATREIVFHDNPDEGWNDALRKKGGIYWVVAETGTKPSLN